MSTIIPKEKIIEKCTERIEEFGYRDIEKAEIIDECFVARCKSPKGQTVVMQMPIGMILN